MYRSLTFLCVYWIQLVLGCHVCDIYLYILHNLWNDAVRYLLSVLLFIFIYTKFSQILFFIALYSHIKTFCNTLWCCICMLPGCVPSFRPDWRGRTLSSSFLCLPFRKLNCWKIFEHWDIKDRSDLIKGLIGSENLWPRKDSQLVRLRWKRCHCVACFSITQPPWCRQWSTASHSPSLWMSTGLLSCTC